MSAVLFLLVSHHANHPTIIIMIMVVVIDIVVVVTSQSFILDHLAYLIRHDVTFAVAVGGRDEVVDVITT
jgi:hypothetical protein